MDILALAGDALVSYLKGKLKDVNLGNIDINKIVNVAEMVPEAKACWEKLSSDNQKKLVETIATLGKGTKIASMLGGLFK